MNKLSVEVLDHIFSFLGSHRRTLVACSKVPMLSPIVERYIYYETIVYMSNICMRSITSLEIAPEDLSHLISMNPRILCHVRILRIQVYQGFPEEMAIENLNTFAKTLCMFSTLEYIDVSEVRASRLPDLFRAAVEDRLRLPTIKQLRLADTVASLSLLDNCKNIEYSVSGACVAEGQVGSTPSQLESLVYFGIFFPDHALDWFKHHVNQLQSLTCSSGSSRTMSVLSVLLGACSRTLKQLNIDLDGTGYSSTYHLTEDEDLETTPLPELSPIPPNLQRLAIHATINVYPKTHDDPTALVETYLPAAAQLVALFGSPLRHLVLDVKMDVHGLSNLSGIDLSPLVVLGAASLSIPRIDLYVYACHFPSGLTLSQLLSLLADYKDVMRAIEKGIIIIHPQETAPECEYI